jgi:hypothetical protein
MSNKKKAKPQKPEAEKSMRGTVSLFTNELNGMRVYLRGKKIFLKSKAGIDARLVDAVEAGYTIRREYSLITDTSPDVAKKHVTIHPKLAKCKWGSEAALKLEKMVK